MSHTAGAPRSWRSVQRASSSVGHGSSSRRAGRDSESSADVAYQPDGLPRLPSHLQYHHHFSPEDHCPVCSLEEGEAHAPGAPSHAVTLLSKPAPEPPLTPRAAQSPVLPLRSIDEHGLALLESLRRPRQLPHWWGPQHAEKQSRCARLLESSGMHYAIIGLTLFDLAIVVTELVLSSIYPIHEQAPHAVHSAEEVLSWVSISILCIFVAELLAKLAVFGHRYFTSSWWHMADAVVVVASLTLELTLRGIAQEVASLLVFFRLWRLLRVMHGVAEAMEVHHEEKLEEHHRLVHGLQQDLSAQHRRVRQLEREVAALSGAALGAGIDVASILRLAASAASQPELLLAEAEAAEDGVAAGASAAAGKGGGSSGDSDRDGPQ